MTKLRVLLVSCGILAACAVGLSAQAAGSIVPDRFLRGYDPVTVFYDSPVGPTRGGPADGPGEFLTVVPPVPGEYRWLDARTIQFLPAVPWPALKDFRIQARGKSVSLTTMMVPPVAISPAPQSAGLEPISSFTMRFDAVLDAESLARMIRIEVRDLPGLTTEGSWWIARFRPLRASPGAILHGNGRRLPGYPEVSHPVRKEGDPPPEAVAG